MTFFFLKLNIVYKICFPSPAPVLSLLLQREWKGELQATLKGNYILRHLTAGVSVSWILKLCSCQSKTEIILFLAQDAWEAPITPTSWVTQSQSPSQQPNALLAA